VLKIHHLGHSQSERIIWLCEELGVPYDLVRYARDPTTLLPPPEFKILHPLGAAPLIEDGDLLLAESGAIVEYVITKHGRGRLKPHVEHPDYATFLYWFHFSNGTLQPAIIRLVFLNRLKLPADNPVLVALKARLDRNLAFVDARLGEAPYFSGNAFTAADVMIVVSLTTMRLFVPLELNPYPNIRMYLKRIGARPAYQRAMAKGEPDLTPLLS
jgi:glutathione S-transferase